MTQLYSVDPKVVEEPRAQLLKLINFHFDYSRSVSISTNFFQGVILSDACAQDVGNEGSPSNQGANHFDIMSASIVGDPSLARFRRTSAAQDDGL